MSDGQLQFNIQEFVLAVEDAEKAANFFAATFNSEPEPIMDFPDDGLELRMGGVWVGDTHVAFSQGRTDDGPISRFLSKRGEGLYEICVSTNDLGAAIEHMKSTGVEFVSEEPYVLRDYRWKDETYSAVHIVFSRPSTTHGVLIELQQWFR